MYIAWSLFTQTHYAPGRCPGNKTQDIQGGTGASLLECVRPFTALRCFNFFLTKALFTKSSLCRLVVHLVAFMAKLVLTVRNIFPASRAFA